MQTIVWDVDDVLNDLMGAWLEQSWLTCHPESAVRYEEISENPPHQLLGISLHEYLVSLDTFRLSEAGQQLSPNSEVLAWFWKYGNRFRHIVLTATPLQAAPSQAEWVIRYYGNWIRSFNFVPSKREIHPTLIYDCTKADFLRWCGRGDIFIDDRPEDVEAVRQLGIQALLMPRPWNKSAQTIRGMLDTLINLL